ncbi:MAG: hypothetical protein K6L80_04650 [Agarilytica sp.]
MNPDDYYRYVLARIGDADTVEKSEALLAWSVKTTIIAIIGHPYI